jgi:hypothetical protein
MTTQYFSTSKISGSYKITFFLAIMFLGFTSMNAQRCKSELKVEKNRNFKSAAENGAMYTLILTNNSTSPQSYRLETKDLEEYCGNDTRRNVVSNVSLSKKFLQENSKQALTGTLTMQPKQSRTFNVHIVAPAGTPFNSWGCIEVRAISENCDMPATTILSVFVPDPSEE